MKMDFVKVRFMPLLMLVSGVAMGFLIRPFRCETESPKMRHVRTQVTRMTCGQLMTATDLYQMDMGKGTKAVE
jgi:hypothetical protein